MTNLFKKSALVVALFAAASAQAGSLATTGAVAPVGFSKQAENVVSVTGAPLTLTTGAAYPEGSIITVTFSAGQLSLPGTAGTNAAGITFDLLEATPTSLKYKVKGAAGIANGETFTLTGYQFTAASLANATAVTATVGVVSVTGVAIDPAGTNQSLTTSVVVAGDQFAGKVTKETKKIDLATGRALLENDTKSFVLTFNTANSNTMFTSTVKSDVAATLAASGKVTHTITGDWGFIVDSKADTAGIQPATGALTASAGCTVKSVTATAVAVECDGPAAAAAVSGTGTAADPFVRTYPTANTLTVDLVKAGASETSPLQNTTFTVNSVQLYGATSNKSVTILADKEILQLVDNGTTKFVDYMPFGENISQIVYVTNLTEEAGKIRLTVWDQDGKKVANNVEVTTKVTANGIIPLAAELKKIVGEKATGKFRFSVSLETSKAEVYAAYRVGADAAYVVVRN